MARPTTISFEEARKFLHYDSETGHFTWIEKPKGGKAVVGQRAGFLHKTSGYRRIAVAGCVLYEHRLAMIFTRGQEAKIPSCRLTTKMASGMTTGWKILPLLSLCRTHRTNLSG